jgi:hypothetical protein
MERGAAMVASLRAGRPVRVEELPTLADSLGGGIGLANRHTFAMVRALVDDTILLEEEEIAAAIRFAYAEEGEVLEGGGAVAIAALIAGRHRPRGPTVLVLSGRNIDMDDASPPDLRGVTMPDVTILTEPTSAASCRSTATRSRRARGLRGARDEAGGDAADPEARHCGGERRGGRQDRLRPGLDSFAIKISPGFFDNPKLGLPSLNGLMVVLSAKTGLVEALLLDNGYLTDVRTAAAGAVAADALARPDAARVLVMGAGVQARLQLRALALVRPLVAATYWARDPEKARDAAREMAETLGIPVAATTEPATAAAEADIIVTTTPSDRADPDGRLAAAGPARHRDGLGRRAQERDRPGRIPRISATSPDRLSQTRPRRAARGAGGRHHRRARALPRTRRRPRRAE